MKNTINNNLLTFCIEALGISEQDAQAMGEYNLNAMIERDESLSIEYKNWTAIEMPVVNPNQTTRKLLSMQGNFEAFLLEADEGYLHDEF